MPPGFVMSPELKRAVQDMIRLQGNSFQPRPKHGRRLARGGGSGNARLAANLYVVTEEIGPATGHASVDGTNIVITPASGMAQPLQTNDESNGANPDDPDYGERTPVGDPVTVYNYDPGETYTVRTGIYVATRDGSSLIEVITAFCTQYDLPE